MASNSLPVPRAGTMQPDRPSPASEVTSGRNSQDDVELKTKGRRRNRAIHSCLECRRRKMKCDRGDPCQNCNAAGRICAYVSSEKDDADFRRNMVEMKEAKDALDRKLLMKESYHAPGRKQRQKRSRVEEQAASDDSGNDTDEGYLEPTPLAVADAAYAHDVDDEIDDLGVRIGRMWLGERIGGLYRPQIADEVWSSLEYSPQGPSQLAISPSPEPGPSSTKPSVGLLFGQFGCSDTFMKSLPPRNIADKLLSQYWVAVHPVVRILHRPTFAERYETIWECIENAQPVTPSLAAIVLSVLHSGVVSMSESEGWGRMRTSRKELMAQLKLGTEMALSRAQLLKTFKIETLQAFVAYLLSTSVEAITRAHSVMTGMLVRQAECMGLHRDPSEFGFSPAECSTRRFLWYQVCYLDLKTSESQGPRPFIHHDGYSTQLPLDVTLSTGPQVWNDAIFSMIRFECQEMQRRCLTHRNRLDQRRMTLTKVLSKIEAFRLSMDAKYGPYINTALPSPMQRMAGVLLKMWVSLLYLIPLHRYMNSVVYRVPDRLRQIVLVKGTEALEGAVDLDMLDELSPWRWYNSAYQTYQSAFLLLIEIFNFPRRREANRIWRCLDFIFAEPLKTVPPMRMTNPTLNELFIHRDVKARYLMTVISKRMRAYHQAKGSKVPSHFKKSMIVITPQKLGDDSDPRMPLNYAHGEPESIDSDSQQDLSSIHVVDGLRENHGHRYETSHPSLTLDNHHATNVWASQQSSPWIHNYPDLNQDSSIFVDANPYGNAANPAISLSSSQYGEPAEIEPQMLEIDWSLWDVIFPPQVNDGDLDISESYTDVAAAYTIPDGTF